MSASSKAREATKEFRAAAAGAESLEIQGLARGLAKLAEAVAQLASDVDDIGRKIK